MNIFVFNNSLKRIGGGYRFIENFNKGIRSADKVVDDPFAADIIFIPSSSMVADFELYEELRKRKKKIVLRVDGVPEDWRNSGRGWVRLKRIFSEADGIIYQSYFVRNTVGRWLEGKISRGDMRVKVILNGVDKMLFRQKVKREGIIAPSLLNINSRKDPNKRIEEVIQIYREVKTVMDGAIITFVGKYQTDLIDHGFGLYDYEMGLDWSFVSDVENTEELVDIINTHDVFLFPSFADPCPNIVAEVLACGVPVILSAYSGGGKEIACDQAVYLKGQSYTEAIEEALRKKIDVSRVRSIQDMVREYIGFFKEMA